MHNGSFVLRRPVLLVALSLLVPTAFCQTCLTQGQIPTARRDLFSQTALKFAGEVQNGELEQLRANTLPAVAADFSGIANSAQTLRPQIQQAALTVDDLYSFESKPAPGAQGAQFFCSPASSTMTVVLSFGDLPPGNYVLAVLHATGVPKPQQIALILAEDGPNQWKLAGFFAKPMTVAGQEGLWYWVRAREYAQKKMTWDAWFYYQIALGLLDPVDFLSSPNLDKLKHEADQNRPQNLPGDQPLIVNGGATFQVTRVDTSSELGPLDLVVHYLPNATETAQLRDPAAARKQVLDLMNALLALHPGLRTAFHGIWVFADQGNASLFALELPMDQIGGGTSPATAQASPAPLAH